MSDAVAVLTVYCSWSRVLGRAARVGIEGSAAVPLRRGGQRDVELAPGRHLLTASCRRWDSAPLTLDLGPGDHRFVLLDIAPAARPGGPAREHVLALTVTDGVDELRRRRDGRGGYGPSPRERAWSRIGVLLLFAGLFVRVLVDGPVGTAVSLPGSCILVVLFFRRFLFRKDGTSAGPPGG